MLLHGALERIITIELEGFDEVDDIISRKLVIELMGKHCNIILLDTQNTIIDSLRHIYDENSTHIVAPHKKYKYPEITKLDFLSCSNFETFKQNIKNTNLDEIASTISNTYHGISKNQVEQIIKYYNLHDLEAVYNKLNQIIKLADTLQVKFEVDGKNYFLVENFEEQEPFSLSFFLDDFYYEKETSQEFKTYRNNLLKMILSTLKKYEKRLQNINNKLEDCNNMDKYRIYGELLTSNLYRIKNERVSEIEIENYYDNNNLTKIPLDTKYLPSENTKRYFKKYNKLKNTLEICGEQKEQTIAELNYIESIVYELESAKTLEELAEIFEEISENVVFKERTKKYQQKKNIKVKKSNLTKNKKISFNPYKYKVEDFTLLVGRNNKENDYLSLKYAKKTDLWFHTKDIHGSHAVLIIENKVPNHEILLKCAEIAASHSKARLSSNVPVDYCEVKYVKKPKNSKPGMVIYTNYSTLYVTPNI